MSCILLTNAVKFPTLDGVPVSDFGVGNSEIASAFMATEKQKNYLKELIIINKMHHKQS